MMKNCKSIIGFTSDYQLQMFLLQFLNYCTSNNNYIDTYKARFSIEKTQTEKKIDSAQQRAKTKSAYLLVSTESFIRWMHMQCMQAMHYFFNKQLFLLMKIF